MMEGAPARSSSLPPPRPRPRPPEVLTKPEAIALMIKAWSCRAPTGGA